MRYLITYFYHVRNLQPNMIPVSTAVWDPKWFHDMTNNQDYMFFDKRGVLNGLRLEDLHPDDSCADLCRGKDACSTGDSSACDFLKKYEEQIMGISFGAFESWCKITASHLNITDNPIIVLLVHEKPDNSCSERVVLKRWFEKNGVVLEEFDKEKRY